MAPLVGILWGRLKPRLSWGSQNKLQARTNTLMLKKKTRAGIGVLHREGGIKLTDDREWLLNFPSALYYSPRKIPSLPPEKPANWCSSRQELKTIYLITFNELRRFTSQIVKINWRCDRSSWCSAGSLSSSFETCCSREKRAICCNMTLRKY